MEKPLPSPEEMLKVVKDSAIIKVEDPIVTTDDKPTVEGSGVTKHSNKSRIPKGSDEAKKRMAYVRSFRKKKE